MWVLVLYVLMILLLMMVGFRFFVFRRVVIIEVVVVLLWVLLIVIVCLKCISFVSILVWWIIGISFFWVVISFGLFGLIVEDMIKILVLLMFLVVWFIMIGMLFVFSCCILVFFVMFDF